ncbi:MAG: NAD-glutamate dehydrogenase [Nocardioidaceae bacterium]|nr:NAD-glutamate dehydrogenase [Nocardioidaceae bacterium]
MRSQRDPALSDVLDSAEEVAATRRGTSGIDGATVRDLLDVYFHHVPIEDVVGRDAEDVYGAAVSHYRLAACRPQGTATVQVSTPTVDEHGWSAAGHTVVEVVTDDMPFLVDSVTMFLARHDHGIHLVVHPQLHVVRDVTGALRGFDESDGVAESWMHVEIDRVEDPERLAALEAGLGDVLRDVRETVEDWTKLRDRARDVVEHIRSDPPPVAADEATEIAELLDWLADDHFTFLGYREYVLGKGSGDDRADADTDAGLEELRVVPGTGLGILRSDPREPTRLPPPVAERARDKELAVITKANSRSTVHRAAYLDYIGIKTFDDSGEVVGERRFLGLFSSAAYTESVTRIPVLRRKGAAVLSELGFQVSSHSGKALLDLLETYPRDDLFQTPVHELAQTLHAVLHLQERRQLRLFVRQDAYRRYLSCLVYLPRDRYTTQVRERMQHILAGALGGIEHGAGIDYTARVSESVLARLHFVVRPPRGELVGGVDVPVLEQRLGDATRSWTDDFTQAAYELRGEADGARLVRAYSDAFPEAYKEDFSARVAVTDLHRLESIDSDDGVGLHLYEPSDAPPGEGRFKVFRTGTPLSLTEVLPLFSSLGVEVVDERPYALTSLGSELPTAWIYDFGLRYDGEPGELGRTLLTEAFLATWRRQAEADGFNRLVLAAALPWRQVSVLRAYARWLRQAGTPFSLEYIEDTLLRHCGIARMLVELFCARFDPGAHDLPADGESRTAKTDDLTDRIRAALDEVASLDHDRILRSYATVIGATVRTNYFVPADGGADRPYLSFKIEPQRIDDVPRPRPRFEVFVYSPRVEGVHLRFGHVARGGLRWSDRREDFRTEVLGLVKAQMVKNAVIVPVGAKGGFYAKHLPDPAADRDAWLAEGTACYRTFISGLLDVTDNLKGEAIVPPPRVVRHDDDDAYLVVAADKGTAAFSDIANEVAKDYGFWLGDGFASGGSAGYDHKQMGITARGAWESVKRHFRELGIDCQSEDFTAVGVGDMSGDVFGNGMLLSEHIRLVAAFDHRHVFLDPDPDAAASHAERRRLFDLQRSSWDDYDRELISSGGGVYPRSAKSVPISSQVAAALGLDEQVRQLPPAQLVSAIIKAPVDLLWNGGIGTYVKASTETHAEAGDKINDVLRVDGADLRARCVGEGGNLGLTQLGRIEYARGGGRITTDFIDNSAGVDTSDHEVNIKVLLDRVVAAGDLTDKQRNALLVRMTDEVAELVLTDNVEQNLALANASHAAPSLLHVHADWMRRLERRGRLDRELEFLPNTKEVERRRAADEGLTPPELAVLLAYTKIVLADELITTDLPDDPFMRAHLYRYFPTAMRQTYRERMDSHTLRREIVVTQAVNYLVNNAGITFFHRLSGETGATADELARAHAIAAEIYGAEALSSLVGSLDHEVDAGVQTRMRLEVRTLVERATRWLVNQRWHLDAERTVDQVGTAVQEVVRCLTDTLAGRDRERLDARAGSMVESGVPEELAHRVAALPPAYSALAIVQVARRLDCDPMLVARLHSRLGQRLTIDLLYDRVLDLPRADRWQTMARAALRDDLQQVHAGLTAKVLESVDSAVQDHDEGTDDSDSDDVDARTDAWIDSWIGQEGTVFERARGTIAEICRDGAPDLARLSVGLRVVRTLLGSER